jgi:hypothetical protein
LGDLDDITAISLRRRFSPELFNTGRGKTISATSGLKRFIKEEYGSRCAVCNSSDNVTAAHILKHKTDCDVLRIPWDATNFIALCGMAIDAGSCHFLFDNFQMSFIHVKSTGQWSVVGGGSAHHGKLVYLATNPRKRSLHSHFTRCLLMKSFIGVDDASSTGTYDSEPLDTSDESEDIIDG